MEFVLVANQMVLQDLWARNFHQSVRSLLHFVLGLVLVVHKPQEVRRTKRQDFHMFPWSYVLFSVRCYSSFVPLSIWNQAQLSTLDSAPHFTSESRCFHGASRGSEGSRLAWPLSSYSSLPRRCRRSRRGSPPWAVRRVAPKRRPVMGSQAMRD